MGWRHGWAVLLFTVALATFSWAAPEDPWAGLDDPKPEAPAPLKPRETLGDIAWALPEKTVVYLSVDMSEASLKTLASASIVKMFRDPEVKAFVDSGIGQLGGAGALAIGAMQKATGIDPEHLKLLAQGRVNLAVTEITPPKPAAGRRRARRRGMPGVKMVGTIDLGPHVATIEKDLAAIIALLEKKKNKKVVISRFEHEGTKLTTVALENRFELTFGIYKKALVFAKGKAAMKPFLTALKKGAAKPLSKTAAYKMAADRADLKGAPVALYINLEPIMKVAMTRMRKHDLREATALGMGDLTTLAYSARVVEGVFKEKQFIGTRKPGSGIMSMLPKGTLKNKTLKYVPKDALIYTAMNVDMPNWWQAMTDLARTMNPQHWQRNMRDQERFERLARLSVKEDIFGVLGGEVVLFVAPPKGWKLFPSMVAILEVKDKPKAKKTIQALIEFVEDEDREFQVKKIAYRGYTIHYIYQMDDRDDMPITPAYIFDGDMLICALMPQTLKDVIDSQKDKGFVSLAASPKFKKVTAGLPKGVSMLTYVDTQTAAGWFYNALLPPAQMLIGRRDNPFNMALLPQEKRLEKYIEPFSHSMRWVEGGLLIEESGPIPLTGILVPLLTAGLLAG